MLDYMDKISVYGATGFIGSVFCRSLPKYVLPIVRDAVIPQTQEILNFVSTTDNYNVTIDPYVDAETNIFHMIDILEAARAKYGNMFTFNMISSWFVYGDTDLPATEASSCDPKGFYSITKRCAEQLLISYCETYDIQWRILRLANVLGVEDKHVSAKKNALQYLIGKILKDEPVELYHGGEFIRDYIDVRDACVAIALVIMKGSVNEIYNISNGVPLVFKDLINKAYKLAGKEATFTSREPSQFHNVVQVKNMYLDNRKIAGLGYKQRFTIEDTLRHIVKHGDQQRLISRESSQIRQSVTP
jgi:nucleoside-diphosphate-sugar epimerase